MVTSFLNQARTLYGIARSLAIYYGYPGRRHATKAFYSRFVRPGGLCFDVGAHVGNRTACFRALGARVITLEPQPALVRVLRLLFWRSDGVIIVDRAIGRSEGRVRLCLNPANPMIATASPAFVGAARRAPSFAGQVWRGEIEVPVVSLDWLIERFGQPDFIKIDVEGFEAEALAGLSWGPPAISLEFVPMQKDVAIEALRHLARLGDYRLNASFGEALVFVHEVPLSIEEGITWLEGQGSDGPAGDLVAALDPGLVEGRSGRIGS